MMFRLMIMTIIDYFDEDEDSYETDDDNNINDMKMTIKKIKINL